MSTQNESYKRKRGPKLNLYNPRFHSLWSLVVLQTYNIVQGEIELQTLIRQGGRNWGNETSSNREGSTENVETGARDMFVGSMNHPLRLDRERWSLHGLICVYRHAHRRHHRPPSSV